MFIEPHAQRIEPRTPFIRATFAGRPKRIEHPTAAYGATGLRVAHNEAIPGQRANRCVEHQLHTRGLASGQRIAIQQRHMGHVMRSAEMHMQRRPMMQGQTGIGEQRQFDIEPV